MKKNVKFFLFFVVFMTNTNLFASGKTDKPDYSQARFYKDVLYELKNGNSCHSDTLSDEEITLCDSVYLYYYEKANKGYNWDILLWQEAVMKACELCQNKAAISAVKAGEFGEKFLQSVIVGAEDIGRGLFNWLNNGSDEYKKRHGN